MVTKVKFRKRKLLSSFYSCKMYSADFTEAASAECLSGTEFSSSLTGKKKKRNYFKPKSQ